MTLRLPTFIKLPNYNIFNYIPRYYDKEKNDRKANRNKIKFRNHLIQNNPNITDQFHRSKLDTSKGMAMFSTLIRIALIVLFIMVTWLIAKYLGFWISSSQ